MTAADLAARLSAKRNGAGWQAKCPAHEDRNPSLSISEGRSGDVLLHCHAGCTLEALVAALGIEKRDLFADNGNGAGLGQPTETYRYTDEHGAELYKVLRYFPKTFRPWHPCPTARDGWTRGLGGNPEWCTCPKVRCVLYHLPQLRTAVAAGKRVFIVEGEKDVAAVERAGYAATCNPGGVGMGWRPEYTLELKGADVVIVADKDEQGRKHARGVATALRGMAKTVVLREAAEGKDAADHLAAGRKPAELVPMAEPVTPDADSPTRRLSPWEHAQPAPEFLAATEKEHDFYESKLIAPGAITELFSPRGLGKTHIAHSLAVKLAQRGLRVLLLDRDNSPREVRRRLKGWAAGTAPTLKVLTRDNAPPLTDTIAWATFPADYDVVVIDSLDATTEGVGEQDSSRPSRALATILDIARRANGPAVLTLGNTVKSAAHSRGSGVVEDRADIVYEVRDATNLAPTGNKPWWEELPPAGAEAWAERATRRKKRTVYRLALVPSKFRVGEEPDPFVLEVDLGGDPWTLRDVTGELTQAGEHAREAAAEAIQLRRTKATTALREAVNAGTELNRTDAVALLMEQRLTQRDARTLLADGEGTEWRTTTRNDLPGKPRLLMPAGGVTESSTEIPPSGNGDATRAPDGDSRWLSGPKGQRESPETGQAPQGVPEVGISVAPLTLPRLCPKGHPMSHFGREPAAGWVCPTCHPAAAAAMVPEPDPEDLFDPQLEVGA